jgi:hypothetical protein
LEGNIFLPSGGLKEKPECCPAVVYIGWLDDGGQEQHSKETARKNDDASKNGSNERLFHGDCFNKFKQFAMN